MPSISSTLKDIQTGLLLLSVAAKTPLACFKEHTVSTNNRSTFGAILSTFSSYIFDASSTGGQMSGLYDAIKGPIEPATRPVPNLSRALQAAATEAVSYTHLRAHET